MTDLVIQQCLTLFDAQAKKKRPPNVALLGPPGSGKSQYLELLLNRLSSDETHPQKFCLMLDLRSIPVSTTDDIYFHINRVLLSEADRVGISKDFDIIVQPPPLRFEEILSNLLKSAAGDLIIFIDHLESVPRRFASDLSQRFRNFLEATEFDSKYSRLGLVVAGALSLFELKRGPDSAFQVLPIVRFPELNGSIRRRLVEDYLQNFMSIEIESNLIDRLAEVTGGEPGFLEPLIMNLLKGGRQIALSLDSINDAVANLRSSAQVPALRNLALHLWGDKSLQEIVRDLISLSTVQPRSVLPDIDRYQLLGPVVVGSGYHVKTNEYQFRNGIVSDFISSVFHELRRGDAKRIDHLSVMDELHQLDIVKANCLGSNQIWKLMGCLREAWEIMTPYPPPQMFIYVARMNATHGWWLDGTDESISGPELRQRADNSSMAVAFQAIDDMPGNLGAGTENLKAYIESDFEQISIGLPLLGSTEAVVVIATLSRIDAGRGLTEFELCHWIRLIQNVRHMIQALATAELGRRLIGESIKQLEQSGSSLAVGRPVVSPNSIRPSKSKKIYLLPRGGGLATSLNDNSSFAWNIEQNTIDDLNSRCLRMVNRWTDSKEVDTKLRGIASQLGDAVRSGGLERHLVPISIGDSIVLATDREGLKIPFELFPVDGTHLALKAAFSRLIINHTLSPEMSIPFYQMLARQAATGQSLRVLLIGSDVKEKLSRVVEELSKIRQSIELGCKKFGIRSEFTEILPANATVDRIQEELTSGGPFQILHYCGHGMHFTEDPAASGIVLANGKMEPEIISCRRLRNWLEGAGVCLAFLSACHSSAVTGDTRGLSDRYLGTIDAFVSAGVPNIVGYRWLISDEGAYHFSTEFYRQLLEMQEKPDPSLAMLYARRSIEGRADLFDAWASPLLVTQSC